MKYPFKEGVVVRATKVITEGGGDTIPDRGTKFEGRFFPGYVHAEKDEYGIVVHIGKLPTVRFLNTGTATVVLQNEVELAWYMDKEYCDHVYPPLKN
jgi:hypothetical protein